MDIAELRQEYRQAKLTKKTLNPDPFLQFEQWMGEAMKAELREPNAMSLATADAKGSPSIRTVLLKYYDREGFVFFTNYESRKSREIWENPRVALLFPWLDLERQVVIMGYAERISTTESMKYFATRPRGSQLGAWASSQSSMITSRKLLRMKFEEIKNKFQHGEVPLPSFWGGFRVVPERFEFWQGRPNRLHDRFEFTLLEDRSWSIQRLEP